MHPAIFFTGLAAAIIGATAVGGITGTAIARTWLNPGPEEDPRTTPSSPVMTGPLDAEEKRWLVGARAVATGDMDDLLASYVPFLSITASYPGDPLLWHGVERLINYSLITEGPEAREIAELIVGFLRDSRLPVRIRESLAALESRAGQR